MLRKLYDRVLQVARGPHAMAGLAAVSFAESSIFPVPPDAMLVPMVFARPERAWLYAGIATMGSVGGASLGYAIGYFVKPVGQAILRLTGHEGGLATMQAWYDQWGVWVILGKGLTPIPFKLVTIASGMLEYAFWPFILACVVTRAGRFFLVAALVKRFGPQIQPIIEKRLALFTGLFLAVVISGVLAVRFLH